MNTVTLFAAAALLAAPALALAAPVKTVDGQSQVTVSFADLNLNTASGQSALKARIHRAAVDACGAQPDTRDLRAWSAFNQCVAKTIGAATAAVPAASLVAGASSPKG
jgi:UrcA family protein